MTTEPITERNLDVFKTDACTKCGLCFELCPELHLPTAIAQQEITALIEGNPTQYVLQNCTTCFSCNLYCPHDCHPYQLILENWNKKYQTDGAPPLYRFVCPTLSGNIWDMLYTLMPENDREWTFKWMSETPKDTVLLIGNYTHIFPDLLGGSALLKDITPVDLLDHWEGGAYLYQGGYLDVVNRIGEKCAQDFEKWGVKKIVPFLDAVEHIFTEVHPKEMNTPIGPEVTSFSAYILEQIQSKKVTFSNQLNLTITPHDNCYSKTNGEKYWNNSRDLIKLTGCSVLEMEHNRKDATCCGFGCGASWQTNFSLPFDILTTAQRKFQEAEVTGADGLMSYCGGCLYLLWAGKELFESPIKLYHSVELVRMAMGEDLSLNQQAHKERAWDIITIITMHLITSSFRKTFFIKQVATDKPINPAKKYIFLRFMRWMLSYQWARKAYRKIFRGLMKKVANKRPTF